MADPKQAPQRTRKARVNFAAERTKLVQYCKISIQVMEALNGSAGNEATTNFMAGQMAALKAVLREIGETVPDKEAHS